MFLPLATSFKIREPQFIIPDSQKEQFVCLFSIIIRQAIAASPRLTGWVVATSADLTAAGKYYIQTHHVWNVSIDKSMLPFLFGMWQPCKYFFLRLH